MLTDRFSTYCRPLTSYTPLTSAWWWLIAQVFSLWPTWVWMSKRMLDGSDDPLGMLALTILGLIIWQHRHALSTQPRLPWLLLGLGLTLIATLSLGKLPSLVIGLFAMGSLTCTLLAFLPIHLAKLPILGLAVLALPLLSSLQFYAGYPLRVVTAEVSAWILMFAYDVHREGSTLLVNNRLIMVDAPCSGVQMAWLGYFSACTVALWYQLNNKQFFLRLPFVGILVLAGNIIRNSILVALQTHSYQVPQWLHQGIGLVALAAVCAAIVLLMMRNTNAPHTSIQKTPIKTSSHLQGIPHTFFNAGIILFLMCSVWSVHFALARSEQISAPQTTFIDWPYHWEGKQLRPLALSEVEERFAENFPGAITRMTDEQRVFVFRHVTHPTRKLHPATDCYKGLGYRIEQEQLVTNSKGLLWRCFVAKRSTHTLQVCERIEDNRGQSYTDTSAWYWSALTQPDASPWMAITIAQPVDAQTPLLSTIE